MTPRVFSRTLIAATFGIATLSLGGCPGSSTTGENLDTSTDTTTDSSGTTTGTQTTTTPGRTTPSNASTNGSSTTTDNSNTTDTGTTQPDPGPAVVTNPLASPTGDVNGDGTVNENDTKQLVAGYGSTAPTDVARYDLNNDGKIDIADLALLVRLITQQ